MMGWVMIGIAGLLICMVTIFPMFHMFGFNYGTTIAAPEHPCIKFSDGKLAIVTIDQRDKSWDSVDTRYIIPCDGYIETIAWFKINGYTITGTSLMEVYMER